VRIRLLDGLGGVDAESWDALVGSDDPFVEHGFLRALETSGSVGEGTGWLPVHVTVWDGDRLVGALPLYEKDHSYGEYIFDWAWADAAMQIGIPYYPKLVSMVPVTPATGRRLLVADDAPREQVVAALLEGVFEAMEAARASSAHLLFLNDREISEVVAAGRFHGRLTQQFHWHNDGYATFDDFLARFRSSSRKQVRRERRRVAEAGLDVRVLTGPELDDAGWRVLPRFYRDTCHRKGSYPYLSPTFFEHVRERIARRLVVAMAFRDGVPVAASINFEKGAHLYGRYWGCTEDWDMLHFELCYYRLIERAIERGMQRFEAGAQGRHKLRRGLLPSPVHSAHLMRHGLLDHAIGEYLPREAASVRRQIAELAERGPFRRERE
jgi:predicted N-acyltransferase